LKLNEAFILHDEKKKSLNNSKSFYAKLMKNRFMQDTAARSSPVRSPVGIVSFSGFIEPEDYFKLFETRLF